MKTAIVFLKLGLRKGSSAIPLLYLAVLFAAATWWDVSSLVAQETKDDAPPVLTVAILPFEMQDGAKDIVSDLLMVHLSANDNLLLVEREELKTILAEESLSLSGLVRSENAVRVGQLTGAKILVTGSVVESGESRYLIAKLISTETSRVIGAAATGKKTTALDKLSEELAADITKKLAKKADQMVAKPVTREDRLAKLKEHVAEKVKDKTKLPTVSIDVSESHVGRQTIDPAAATEIAWYLTSLGFTVLEKDRKASADVVISGEGISEFAARHGDLLSVKARLEIKATDNAKSELIVADRQTGVAVDLVENIAGKSALQDSAAQIVVRLVPAIVKWNSNRE